MRWFVEDQIGLPLFWRIAWALVETRKAVDLFIAPTSGTGKSTLIECLSRALGTGSVESFDAKKTLGKGNSDRFSQGVHALTTAHLVIFDEADKADYGENTFNELTNDRVYVEQKYVQGHSAARTAHIMLYAADYPEINVNVQGGDTRFHWVHEKVASPISSAIRSQLMAPEALTYLATLLLDEGAKLLASGGDGGDWQTAASAAHWHGLQVDQEVEALKSLLQDSPGDEETAKAIQEAVALYLGCTVSQLSKTVKWKRKIQTACPSAQNGQRKIDGKTVAVWHNVQLR